MENNFVDFGKLFETFLRKKATENPGMTSHEMEHKLAEFSEEWENTSFEELDGETPKKYLDDISDPKVLIELLRGNCGSEFAEGIVIERIANVPQCVPFLIDALGQDTSVEFTVTCLEILKNYEISQPLKLYLDMIETDVDSEIKETLIDILKDHADEAAPLIYDRIDEADIELKTIYAEILIEAKKDDRTYNLLIELFSSVDNIPLYAGYLGKYGDERCAPILYRALDNCPYSDFIEIKNAIERMGGLVDDEMRDFSEDETYKKIKNL